MRLTSCLACDFSSFGEERGIYVFRQHLVPWDWPRVLLVILAALAKNEVFMCFGSIWCRETNLMSCLVFEQIWGRTMDWPVFLLVFRVGNLWQGRSMTDLGIDSASSVGLSVHTSAECPGFDPRVSLFSTCLLHMYHIRRTRLSNSVQDVLIWVPGQDIWNGIIQYKDVHFNTYWLGVSLY